MGQGADSNGEPLDGDMLADGTHNDEEGTTGEAVAATATVGVLTRWAETGTGSVATALGVGTGTGVSGRGESESSVVDKPNPKRPKARGVDPSCLVLLVAGLLRACRAAVVPLPTDTAAGELRALRGVFSSRGVLGVCISEPDRASSLKS